jgi:hypothetical protein
VLEAQQREGDPGQHADRHRGQQLHQQVALHLRVDLVSACTVSRFAPRPGPAIFTSLRRNVSPDTSRK